MEEQRASATTVYKFLNEGAKKALTLPQFTEWWKTLSPEEKTEYANGAQALTAHS